MVLCPFELKNNVTPSGCMKGASSSYLELMVGPRLVDLLHLPTGRWSKSTNLGPTINSKYDEDAPFMHPDGVTLFFSSNGHNTMGGYDIYFAVQGDSGWYPPQN